VFGKVAHVCMHTFLPDLIGTGSIVVDLGANDGDFAHAMIERFGCRVIAAEPVRDLLGRIQPHPLLQVLPVAVGGSNQSLSVNIYPSRCASVLGAVSVEEKAVTQSADMITLTEFLRRAGIDRMDLLKVDIEGAEIDMFDSCSDEELCLAMQITVEFHDFIYPEHLPAIRRICERMRDNGFAVLPFTFRNAADVLFINRESGVGRAEIAYLKSVSRYGRGLSRVLRRVAS